MGYRLRELRRKQLISQNSLSKMSGVSRTIISGIESGRVRTTTTGTLLKLAKALNVSVEEIFFDSHV